MSFFEISLDGIKTARVRLKVWSDYKPIFLFMVPTQFAPAQVAPTQVNPKVAPTQVATQQ